MIIIPVLLLSILAVYIPFWEYNIYSISFFVFFVFLYLKSLKYDFGDPQVLILSGIILFNSRPFLDVLFDSNTFGDTQGFFKSGGFEPEYLKGALWYIKLSILMFLVGMFRTVDPSINKYPEKFDIITNSYYKSYILFLCIPTLISTAFIIVLCSMNGGYAYFNSGNFIVVILRLFLPFLTVCLTVNLIFYQRKFITVAILILSFGVALIVGARIVGLMPILCLMVFSSYKYRKKYNRYLPFFAFFIIMFTVFVNFFRSGFELESNLSYFFFIEFFLNEISFTTNLMPMAIEYVESNGLSFGINYIGALASIVPKLAFWMTVSDGTYSFSSALGLYYDPVSISKGLGLNGSLIAESYFSFGYAGLIVIVMISASLRLLFRRISHNLAWSYFVISSSPYLITIFIFDSTIFVRSVFYYSILPLFIYYFFVKKFKRESK